jgi:hypothetical protein
MPPAHQEDEETDDDMLDTFRFEEYFLTRASPTEENKPSSSRAAAPGGFGLEGDVA